jgi:hypothetical protein
LRRVPSPLQGTSHNTRSKRSWLICGSNVISEALGPFLSERHPGKCWASLFVTIKLAVHIQIISYNLDK